MGVWPDHLLAMAFASVVLQLFYWQGVIAKWVVPGIAAGMGGAQGYM